MIHSYLTKTRTFLISLLFMIFSVFFSANLVNAKEISGVEIGDFTYNLDEDTGTATVTKYNPGWWSRNFGDASKSDSIVIPESVSYKNKKYYVTRIGDYFSEFSEYMWKSHKETVTGKSIEIVGNYAFGHYNSIYISTVNFPEATVIGDGAFSGCNSLTNIKIRSDATTIGEGAFKDCWLLTNIYLPKITKINEYTFSGCDNLSHIYIPKVETIGEYAFLDCQNLIDIDLPNVTLVGNSAFSGCRRLKNVNLPNAITIGDGVFSSYYHPDDFYRLYGIDMDLVNINLPNVTSIGNYTFASCHALKDIETPRLKNCSENVFYGLPEGVTFKVPESMKNFGLEKLPNGDKINIVYIEEENKQSDLGKKIVNNGIVNYVDEHGKTSTEITEHGMVWLKETSDGTSAWYGIDNSDGTFKIGSKFWVKWLSPKIDREEFEEYYNKLDDEHKKKVDKNHLWIFLTGVTDPDGNEYTNFYGNLNYYIQIGDDWDKDDINVVFISGNKDSVLDVSYVTLECPEGEGEFAKVVMKHFSPYAVYDEKDEIKVSNISKSASIKTGESVSELTFMFWVSLLLVAFLNRKMNKNSICL